MHGRMFMEPCGVLGRDAIVNSVVDALLAEIIGHGLAFLATS